MYRPYLSDTPGSWKWLKKTPTSSTCFSVPRRAAALLLTEHRRSAAWQGCHSENAFTDRWRRRGRVVASCVPPWGFPVVPSNIVITKPNNGVTFYIDRCVTQTQTTSEKSCRCPYSWTYTGQTDCKIDFRSTKISWFLLISAHLHHHLNSTSSSPVPCSIEVSQGSFLGPHLFSIYTSSLDQLLSSHDFRFPIYADDTQFYLYSSASSFRSLTHDITNL